MRDKSDIVGWLLAIAVVFLVMAGIGARILWGLGGGLLVLGLVYALALLAVIDG